VKLGISDGISTEVLEGLAENDSIVTGATLPKSAAATPGSSNPFSPRRPF
jgi:HlyD family secretion protein